MTAIVEFILALITTLSSKPIRFLVNRKNVTHCLTQFEKIQKMIDFSLNLWFRVFRKQFLYLLSVANLGGTSRYYFANLGEHHGIARFFRARIRETSKIVSPLLKVVETCSWAQNDRNIQVYISTYNKFKLV